MGFGLMFRWLRRQGYSWNHKRVYKIYCELALNLRIKPKKRLPARTPVPLHQPTKPNSLWFDPVLQFRTPFYATDPTFSNSAGII